jgi:hypothetical protein
MRHSPQKGRILRPVLYARKQRDVPDSRSDSVLPCEQAVDQRTIKAKRSELRNGLTCRQRMFILEELVGRSDKEAALSAGYSLSVAENTKQRIWKPRVRAEFERLLQVRVRQQNQIEVAVFSIRCGNTQDTQSAASHRVTPRITLAKVFVIIGMCSDSLFLSWASVAGERP